MKIFEDMFSSHRGAGVIGTIVAVGVLVALGSLFLLVFNDDYQGADRSIESIIRDQTSQIQGLNASIVSQQEAIKNGRNNKKIAEEIESYSRQVKLREERVTDAKRQIDDASAAVAESQKKWDQYIIAYRKAIRAKTIGAQYPEITTQSGRKYSNVTIKKIDDLRITVAHDGGSGSIPWNELPSDVIDRLQFTKELADTQTKLEQNSIQHFSNAADSSNLKEAIAGIELKIKETEDAFRVKREAAAMSSGIIDRARSDISRLQQMISQELNKEGLRQTPRYRSQIQDNERIIQTENSRMAEFGSLQAKHQETIAGYQSELQACRDKLAKMEK